MFGSKKYKNTSSEEKGYLSQILEKKAVFNANIFQIEVGEKRILEDIAQVEENTADMVERALLNVSTETALIQSMEEFGANQEKAFSDYVKLSEGIREQMEAGMELVEQNKHFTKPAKYLSDVPSVLREKNKFYEAHLGELEECGKKIGVLALNAAIEAGRLGDDGKQYVAAAEEIRQSAINYEKTAVAIREEIRESYKELQALENSVRHMVQLLKDSNMGAAKLLKKCQDNSKLLEGSAMRDFTEEVEEFKDKIVGLRNLEEEIVKSGERDKLQLGDMKEELLAIKKDIAEIDSDISYLMDLTEEKMNS